jgi:Ca2+-binding EF-hand superfamily protein
MKAFNKIDKDSNSLIDFKEMMDFLNEGKKVLFSLERTLNSMRKWQKNLFSQEKRCYLHGQMRRER